MYTKTRLISKKNQVNRVVEGGKSYIEKIFYEPKNMKIEIEIQELLNKKGCNAPKIIKAYKNTLILEDLGDVTLLDWYEKAEREYSKTYEAMLKKLSQWMKAFYFVTKNYYKNDIMLGDVNFRNFIIKENEVFGIDFEEVNQGNVETDIGNLLAFAMTYYPESKWKIDFSDKLMQILLTDLKLSEEVVIRERENALIRIKSRRSV